MRKRKAFTLVELLTVIGIIAILMSLLFAVYGSTMRYANRVKCQANLRSLAQGLRYYLNDNQDKFPSPAVCERLKNPYRPHPLPEDWIYWQPNRNMNDSKLAKYVSSFNSKLLVCPSDDPDERTRNWFSANDAPYKYSYVFNQMLYYTLYQPNQFLPNQQWGKPLRAFKLRKNIITFVCEAPASVDDGLWWPQPQGGFGDMLSIKHDSPSGLTGEKSITGVGDEDTTIPGAEWPVPNSKKRGNVVFLDGHVEYISRKEVHHPRLFDPTGLMTEQDAYGDRPPEPTDPGG